MRFSILPPLELEIEIEGEAVASVLGAVGLASSANADMALYAIVRMRMRTGAICLPTVFNKVFSLRQDSSASYLPYLG